MAKFALCIDAQSLLTNLEITESQVTGFIPNAFWQSPTRLVDREICEKDESTLQIIPYLTLFDPLAKRYFVYSRGIGSGEQRLMGALSIGLGGHVDETPRHDLTLAEWLEIEGKRELAEEAGIHLSGGQSLNLHSLIINRDDPVGRVHIGVSGVIHVAPEAVKEMEPGIVEKGQWLTLEELGQPHTFNRLERWSQLLVEDYATARALTALKKLDNLSEKALAAALSHSELSPSVTAVRPESAKPMPDPTEADLADPVFNAVYNVCKTWDVNVPECYNGYCGFNGSHAMLIVRALRAANLA